MTAETGTVILSVATRDEMVARMEAAMHGEAQGAAVRVEFTLRAA